MLISVGHKTGAQSAQRGVCVRRTVGNFDGINALNDLTAAMGIQPASLYKAFGNKRTLFEKALARYLAGPVAFVHDALNEPTAFAVADRILRRTAEFLTEGRSRRGCMTIQAALAGGVEGEPIRRKLIALRVKEQDALRRRFERAKSEGGLPNDADAADLARFVTALFQGEAGAQAFSVVVQLGGAKSIRTDERKSGDAEAAIRKHHHLLATSDYQCCQ